MRSTVRWEGAGMGAGAGSEFEEEAALGAGNMINTTQNIPIEQAVRHLRIIDCYLYFVIIFLDSLTAALAWGGRWLGDRGGIGGWDDTSDG